MSIRTRSIATVTAITVMASVATAPAAGAASLATLEEYFRPQFDLSREAVPLTLDELLAGVDPAQAAEIAYKSDVTEGDLKSLFGVTDFGSLLRQIQVTFEQVIERIRALFGGGSIGTPTPEVPATLPAPGDPAAATVVCESDLRFVDYKAQVRETATYTVWLESSGPDVTFFGENIVRAGEVISFTEPIPNKESSTLRIDSETLTDIDADAIVLNPNVACPAA